VLFLAPTCELHADPSPPNVQRAGSKGLRLRTRIAEGIRYEGHDALMHAWLPVVPFTREYRVRTHVKRTAAQERPVRHHQSAWKRANASGCSPFYGIHDCARRGPRGRAGPMPIGQLRVAAAGAFWQSCCRRPGRGRARGTGVGRKVSNRMQRCCNQAMMIASKVAALRHAYRAIHRAPCVRQPARRFMRWLAPPRMCLSMPMRAGVQRLGPGLHPQHPPPR
jgi:hypothetical protein